ncbi:MAG: hypothetical protein GX973_01085 [Firmicutes bacterium]|nr:hypothetical protein [Bacillota bacterium]
MESQYKDYLKMRDKYGYSSDFLTVDCAGIDEIMLNKISPFIVTGKIDRDKLNSGEEILLIAPPEYALLVETTEGGWQAEYIYNPDPAKKYSTYRRNDMFQTGDKITVSLLYTDELVKEGLGKPFAYLDDGSRKLPDDAVRIDKTVTIGALLTPRIGDSAHYLSSNSLGSNFLGSFSPDAGDLITTTAGLEALGFDPPYKALTVTLEESPDAAREEYLETNLKMIAARTAGVKYFSYVALSREQRQIIYGMLAISAAILILLFAICASMINNALSARLRAGRREIGTLRAVGASRRVIERSYRWQLFSMFTWGTLIGLAVELALCGWLLKTQEDFGDFLPVWQPLLFVALLFGLSLWNLRSKIGSIFKESIVDNIREL